jgi:endonuclease/exonuclease/phosphatase family metal-dependent hydrolase
LWRNRKALRGGMAVLWDEQIEVEVEFSSQELINLICFDYESRKKMRLTCVHAPNRYGERLQLWEKLRQMASSNTLPWMCMGDFNEILYY